MGPDSVGYQITEKALCFGGDVCTATDIAVRLGMTELGDKRLVAHLDEAFAQKAMDAIRTLCEDSIDAMKVSSEDVDVILVGGGSIILPGDLAGARSVTQHEFGGVANAIGSAISKVSGTYEQLIDYDKIPRDQALAQARADAIELAVAAGAIRETVEIIENRVYINGERLDEDYETTNIDDVGVVDGKLKLAGDEYFVLGDNRENSEDSRSADVGNVKREYIYGKAWFVISPREHFGFVK